MGLKGWKICKIFGIDIEIHPSWFIIFALFTFSLANYFGYKVPGHSSISYWLYGAVTVIALFICVIVHELAHSRVAQHLGISMKRITLMLIGGAAQLEGAFKSAKIEFLVAIAGPLSSIALAGIFWSLSKVLNFGVELLTFSLGYLAFLNFILAVFNLLPAYPMDGGRLVRAGIWKISGDQFKATKWATLLGKGIAILLMVAGFLYFSFWIIIVGFILLMHGGSEYQQLVAEKILSQGKVKEAMEDFPFTADPKDMAADAVCASEDILLDVSKKMAERSMLYVVENNKIIGKISKSDIRAYIFIKKQST